MILAARRERVVAVAVARLDAAVEAFDDELDALLAGELTAVGFCLGFGREGGEGKRQAVLGHFLANTKGIGGYFNGEHRTF